MLALADGFAISDRGEVRLVAPVEQRDPDTRLSDGACDSHGRFWAGTMQARPGGGGTLSRLEEDLSVVAVLEGVTISNGIGWSPDDRLMYYVDSPTGGIDVFDFEPSSGDLANRRRFVTIAPENGLPDGLTVDAEGGVWLAPGTAARYGGMTQAGR